MFEIETGVSERNEYWRIDKGAAVIDAVLDQIGHDAPQEEIDAAVAKMIIRELQTPKTLKTVRRHLIAYWKMIAPMAERSPASFDAVLIAFAEIQSDNC